MTVSYDKPTKGLLKDSNQDPHCLLFSETLCPHISVIATQCSIANQIQC